MASASAARAGGRAWGPVLVVEDHDDAREGVVSVLRAVGYEAIGAANGREALLLVRTMKMKPAFVLVDLMMPEMAGWQLREKLWESDPDLTRVPMILMSGYEHTLNAIQNGPSPAPAVLTKPIDADELLKLVANQIGATSAR